ncbi:MAG: tRNA lysidine(34) synthetase TilS [Sedimentisphaerales bacterium]|nr:tRNA lysidine(34) synthetase TilS [Sedimentisphaerales bacterium]
MLLEFEKKVAGFIKANGLFDSAGKILLAVSGGADSTALLYALCAIKEENILRGDILCAHINHQLRGSESDGDEDFVIAQAEKLGLAITTRRVDVREFADKNKLSIETAARKLRIESLLNIAKANNCGLVATAHQKDDNAETVIHRLVRGTGFRGLGGIWPVRIFAEGISFVRPLLCVRRDEILEYLKKRNLKWREDRTNADCTYRRNFIRHRLLLALQQQCSNSIAEQLSEMSQSAQRFYSLVCGKVEKIWPELADCTSDKVTLDLESFLARPPAVKIEIVRRSLTYLGSGERDLTQQHYERVLQVSQEKTSGRIVELPGGFVVWREYNKLIFARRQEKDAVKKHIDETIELQVPGRTQFGSFLMEAIVLEADKKQFEKFKQEKSSLVEWFDFDKVKLPLAVRFRRSGDKFRPLGLAGEKRIGKFLTAAKTPREERNKALIVADTEKVIWVWPVRISEQVKVTDTTRKVLQLRITDTNLAD